MRVPEGQPTAITRVQVPSVQCKAVPEGAKVPDVIGLKRWQIPEFQKIQKHSDQIKVPDMQKMQRAQVTECQITHLF